MGVYRLRVTRIVSAYVVLALLWIIGSDYVAGAIYRGPAIHTYKGMAFVLLTGALLYFVLHRADLSLRRFDSELVASREQFRRVIENAPEAIFIQMDGNFHYVNPSTLKLLGAGRPEDLLGTAVVDRVHEAGREVARARIRALREGLGPVPAMEQRFLQLGGGAVDVEVSAAPFELAGRRGAVVFVRDISDRKAAERQKQQLEEQVRQAQKLESVGRLAGGVAHDFNNLLTVINGYSDMLLASLPDSGAEWGFIREIRDAGERAAGLTAQLLTFSRKHSAEPSVVGVNAMVSEVNRMLRRLVGEHIQIVTDLSPQVGCVLADPTSMNQVVMNLIVNARDAMPAGGSISISTSSVQLSAADCRAISGAEPGKYILLSVSDTGQGIPPENLARIFEPFFTTKGETHGTGLGLSTVYGIVRNAGGWIDVDSRVGEGTTMRVWLPAHFPPTAELENPAGGERTGGTETVLLVEDDPAVRQATKTMLTQFGYRVICADGALDALDLVEQRGAEIHLVLTDIIMPKMTGPQLVGRLREKQHALRAMLMSGYRPEEMLLDRPEPDLPCIAKPFAPLSLARRVREVLDENGSERTSANQSGTVPA